MDNPGGELRRTGSGVVGKEPAETGKGDKPEVKNAKTQVAKASDWTAERVLWFLGLIVVLVVVYVAADKFLVQTAIGKDKPCKVSKKYADLASAKRILWTLHRRPRPARVAIALDDHIVDKRTASTFVRLRPTKRNRRNTPARKGTKVGAFVLGGSLTNEHRGLGFRVFARGTRGRDGRTIHVSVCTRRPADRNEAKPGRYTGTVRVAGYRMRAADIPVVITIKAARTEIALLAVLIALVGAILGAANSKPAEGTTKRGSERGDRLLSFLPFLTGLVAGLVAAAVVYLDDPTFGAERGTDMAKLVFATFAAATSGLSVAAAPSRGLRKKLTR
jgi:hypothetical protein